VALRWLKLFSGPPAIRHWLESAALRPEEQYLLQQWCAMVQRRLSDISWFMRCLNEPIARWANAEDNCTGRFWEGRFKSQALLDETALLQCMTYVDLNPIRAGIAVAPESSNYTAIQRRISRSGSHGLMPFSDESDQRPSIPCDFKSYMELVDWGGRILLPSEQGATGVKVPSVLKRLNVDSGRLAAYLKAKPDKLPNALGPTAALRRLAQSFGLKFLQGMSARKMSLIAG
jgi:hypothetical protein